MPFEGFDSSLIPVHSQACGPLHIHAVRGGKQGPPLVLLHGYPQTYFIWHKIATRLAQHYQVVCIDLRGYGKSSKPKGSDSHVEYSKREMAKDVVAVAQYYGFQSFNLICHDRGARVGHRLALDHPHAVLKLMTLDICPTLYMYEHTNQHFATKYWHWFFQLIPGAEDIIMGNPAAYFRTATRSYDFTTEAQQNYFQAFATYESVHGSCEDYRAAASIDLEHDRADRAAGKKLTVPELRVLWASQGLIPIYGDIVGVWREYSDPSVKITGRAVESNHYLPEMADEDIYKEILAFVPPQ
ncbi:MAG: hypothetical protein CYPHOPRED_004296 [Cyphobasidiales sp. Tagirdzhanova-0007]|nr:MAG: hypothetical protein CYPHOPRED_004296 [Cyphobasidiales sp. Tagirdzhanova-0007]